MQQVSRAKLYPHQNSVADDGTPLAPANSPTISIGANPRDGKKHHKKAKRIKNRSGKGYE